MDHLQNHILDYWNFFHINQLRKKIVVKPLVWYIKES